MPDLAWFIIVTVLVIPALLAIPAQRFFEARYERRETRRRLPPVDYHVHRWVRSQEPVEGVWIEECLCKAVRFEPLRGVERGR